MIAMQGGEISPIELFMQAGPVVKAVIAILLAASLWCWIIIFEALWTLSRLRSAIKSEGSTKGRLVWGIMTRPPSAARSPHRHPSPRAGPSERAFRWWSNGPVTSSN